MQRPSFLSLIYLGTDSSYKQLSSVSDIFCAQQEPGKTADFIFCLVIDCALPLVSQFLQQLLSQERLIVFNKFLSPGYVPLAAAANELPSQQCVAFLSLLA